MERVLLGLGLLLLVLLLLLPSDWDCVAALRFCCTAYPGIELPPRDSVGFARPTGLPTCMSGYWKLSIMHMRQALDIVG